MIRPLVALIFLCCFTSTALAGDWRVIPIRLFLGPQIKNDSVRLINNASEPLNLQLNATVWSQNEQGEDIYEETSDIIFFPRVLSIPPGEERLLRVGYKFPAVAAEKTYRLFIEEIPNSTPEQVSQVMVAVRFGLPIFVAPPKTEKAATIDAVTLAQGEVTARVVNNGNTHVLPNKVAVSGKNASGETLFSHDMRAWYILTGNQRSFTATIPPDECNKASSLYFEFISGSLQLTDEKPLSKSDCQP